MKQKSSNKKLHNAIRRILIRLHLQGQMGLPSFRHRMGLVPLINDCQKPKRAGEQLPKANLMNRALAET